MSVSDRASALAPYAEQLVNNRDVQDALQRAAVAGRDTYHRARGKTPAKAVKDKRLRRRAQATAHAGWDAWVAIAEPNDKRHARRWGRRVALVGVVAAGAFVALNADARDTIIGLVSDNHANPSE
jgi:hypothetical protein